MAKLTWLVLMALAACTSDVAIERACERFISRQLPLTSLRVDAERLDEELMAAKGEEWDKLECEIPRQPRDGQPAVSGEAIMETSSSMPVRAFRHGRGGGIVFISPSVEEGTQGAASGDPEGLAATIAWYDEKGALVGATKVAEFLRYEGYARAESSYFDKGTLTTCVEDLEFFEYDTASGDVVGERGTPLRLNRRCRSKPLVELVR